MTQNTDKTLLREYQALIEIQDTLLAYSRRLKNNPMYYEREKSYLEKTIEKFQVKLAFLVDQHNNVQANIDRAIKRRKELQTKMAIEKNRLYVERYKKLLAGINDLTRDDND